MNLCKTPKSPATRGLICHLLLHLSVEFVLGDLPQPAEHHRDQEGVEVLEILVVIWNLCVNSAKEVFLLVLESLPNNLKIENKFRFHVNLILYFVEQLCCLNLILGSGSISVLKVCSSYSHLVVALCSNFLTAVVDFFATGLLTCSLSSLFT